VKTVVQVLLNLGHGGMEAMAVSLAAGLDRARYRSVVIALDAGGEYEAVLRDAGVEAHVLEGRRLWSPGFHLELARLLRRLQADVVHTHHFSPLLHSLPAARLAGVRRRVHTEHSYQYLESRADYRRALRLMGKSAHAFVLVAQSMHAYYRDTVRLEPKRLRIIPNGVDTGVFAPSPKDVAARRGMLGVAADAYVVGTAGRFFAEKDYGTLLRGFAAFAARNPGAHLAMIGDGPERPALEALAQGFGERISPRIHFLGWRTDLVDLLPLLDAFVLSSKSEALPLVALESLACGVPIVVTPVGDLPDVVADNGSRAGTLFPVGDAAALADALAELANPDMRAALGKRGRARVLQRYSQDAMVRSYTHAYEGVEVIS
jgi:glycosyltransferase involved in cell wall biosynthesis